MSLKRFLILSVLRKRFLVPNLQAKARKVWEAGAHDIEDYDKLEIKSLSGTGKRSYVNGVAPYLYYFDVKFDNREGELKDNIAVVPTINRINASKLDKLPSSK